MLNYLSKRLRNGPAKGGRADAPRARPRLEALEDRLVMSTIPNVEATPVFMGQDWQGQGWSEFVLYANVNGIVNSPYMDALQSAGYGVGRGSVSGYQTLLNSNITAGATVTDAQVQQNLDLDIIFSAFGFTSGGQSLPLPDPNRLYVVFLPQNVTFTSVNSDGSVNSSAVGAGHMSGWNNGFTDGFGTYVHYVVIPFPGGTNVSANGVGNLDAITETLSHEIAEAVTGQQIGDNTENYHYRMSNGVAVQEVGSPGNYSNPIAVPGATPLRDIYNWGTPN